MSRFEDNTAVKTHNLNDTKQFISLVEKTEVANLQNLSSHIDYRPDIDGMRAIAVLSVLFFHIFPTLVPGGFIGVDIFFVLSGYLISSIIFKGLKSGNFSFKDFYIRRIRRIFPSLMLVLVSVLVMGFVVCVNVEFSDICKFVRSSASFTTNLRLHKGLDYFDIETYRKPLVHIWSLSLEEQFYIFFPIAVYFGFKSKKLLLPLLVSAMTISFVLNVYYIETVPMSVFYLLPTRAWELLIGTMLAYQHILSNSKEASHFSLLSDSRLASNILAIFGLSTIAFALFMFSDKTIFPGYAALLPTIGTVCLLASNSSFLNKKILSQTQVVWVGLISYSLYLWHWPLMSFAFIYTDGKVDNLTRIFVFGSSFVLAAFSTFLIEKPIRKQGTQTAYKLGYIMCSILVLSFAMSKFRIDTLSSYTTPGLNQLNISMKDWGYDAKKLNRNDPRNFPFPSYGDGKRIMLFFGDSNMEQYWPRLKRLMDENDNIKSKYTFVFATKGGQMPIPGVEKPASYSKASFLTKAEKYIYDESIDSVVFSSCWTFWLETDMELTKKYCARLKEILLKLKKQGKKTYLILSIPIETQQHPVQMIERRLFSPWIINLKKSYDSQISIDRSKRSKSMLIQVAQETGTEIIDPFTKLCANGQCILLDDNNVPAYKDFTHLTATYTAEHATYIDQIFKND